MYSDSDLSNVCRGRISEKPPLKEKGGGAREDKKINVEKDI
jgi:hypothetical protein